jgi:hypothetical protein
VQLISRGNLADNILNELWSAHFVDRRVKECLKRMLEVRDKGLIRLIRKRTPKLQPTEIAQSLRRLEILIESPSPAIAIEPNRKGKENVRTAEEKKLAGRKGAGQKAAQTRKHFAHATLADLFATGVLSPPLRLFRKYKGNELEATLLPDGRIEFQGQSFDSCSTAAETARSTVTGRRMNTNGWVFWQFLDSAGQAKTLDDAREKLLANKGIR